jgi:2-oxoglutarate dehydrogenase E2 component (dihydrolipoamide succinyltransferase)
VFTPAAPVTRISPAVPVARITPMPPTPPAAPSPPAARAVPAAAMPAARRLSVEFGIDLTNIAGTARGGVVSKPDVLAAMSGPVVRVVSDAPDVPVEPVAPAAPATPAAPASPAPSPANPAASAATPPSVSPPAAVRRPPSAVPRETREKMSTRRKRIAENLLLAQHSTAHLTTFNEIDMSALVALRERMRVKVEKEHGVKLSFMPFFAKAAIMALKAFPVVNAQIDGDSVVYKHYVNLGVAVASDAGLVVPNVKDADSLGILGLSQEIAAIANRARDGKLTMDDLTAGTFTITNGGVFGSLISTPIINYPQSAILGLHKMQDRPVAIAGQVAIRPMMYVALSYDHRIIDGQQAVLYLVKVKELMEDPASMLID